MRWVVDASVAAKWLAPEAESAQAVALLDQDELWVPDLLFAEVANILWKKQARGELPEGAAMAAARWLQQVPLHVHETSSLLVRALELSIRLGHPAYDCVYLALAESADACFVTADRRLFERVQREDTQDWRLRVVNLSELDLSTLGAPPSVSLNPRGGSA